MASLSDRKLATRYARALLAVLSDPAQAEAAEAFLVALRDAIERSTELRTALLDPVIPASARNSLLQALADQHGMPPRLKNFLRAVVEHGRTPVLPTIADVYRE